MNGMPSGVEPRKTRMAELPRLVLVHAVGAEVLDDLDEGGAAGGEGDGVDAVGDAQQPQRGAR